MSMALTSTLAPRRCWRLKTQPANEGCANEDVAGPMHPIAYLQMGFREAIF
jgi:hypothetical protein